MIDNFEAPKHLNELAIKGVKDQATLDELRKSLLKEKGSPIAILPLLLSRSMF